MGPQQQEANPRGTVSPLCLVPVSGLSHRDPGLMGATCSKSWGWGTSSACLPLLSAGSTERLCKLQFWVCSWVLGERVGSKHVSLSQIAGVM